MAALTASHWVYLVGIIVILATMLLRKNILVPAVFFTFLTAVTFSGSLATGLSSVFNASLVAAKELFSIFLIIALVTGMLGALKALGADQRMVAPFRPLMRNGHLAFWTLVVVTYLISLFFWPTPAVPLIGAVLIPVAIAAGLRPLAVGFTVAVAGQGMALSSDFVIRVAPGLSAKAANADPDIVANRAMILSLIVGGVALAIGYALEVKHMRRPSPEHLADWDSGDLVAEVARDTDVPNAFATGRSPKHAVYRLDPPTALPFVARLQFSRQPTSMTEQGRRWLLPSAQGPGSKSRTPSRSRRLRRPRCRRRSRTSSPSSCLSSTSS